MPDLPISGLPENLNPTENDLFVTVNGGVTKKVTLANIAEKTKSYANYYGSFYTTSSLNLTSINTSYTASLEITDFAYGVSAIGTKKDKIQLDHSGIYDIQFSAQINKTNSSKGIVHFWLAKNGSDMPWTNTGVTVAGGSNDLAFAAWNFFVSASAGDTYSLVISATTNNLIIESTPSPADGPEIPGLIVTVNRVA